jgi:hypothetical protein
MKNRMLELANFMLPLLFQLLISTAIALHVVSSATLAPLAQMHSHR